MSSSDITMRVVLSRMGPCFIERQVLSGQVRFLLACGKGRPCLAIWGRRRVTVQRLKVVESRSEENLLFVRGAIPGAINGVVVVRKSKKS